MSSLLVPVRLDDVGGENDDVYDDARMDDDEPDDGSPLAKLRHDKLIRSIARLDKTPAAQRKIKRSEPARTLGDQDVSMGSLKPVSIAALLKSSVATSDADKALKKKLLTEKQGAVLAEPLRKMDAAKLQRTVAYEEVGGRGKPAFRLID